MNTLEINIEKLRSLGGQEAVLQSINNLVEEVLRVNGEEDKRQQSSDLPSPRRSTAA